MTKYKSVTTGLHRWSRTWEVQKSPFVKPLPYRYVSSRETPYPYTTHGQSVMDAMFTWTYTDSNDNNLITIATNAARQKVIERAKGGASAALGLTILDWRTSLSMISGALTALASKRARARLYYRRKASDIYLEGIFGWLPLMSDIYQAHEVLQRAIPASFQKGKGNASYGKLQDNGSTRASIHFQVGVQAGLGLRLDNPNVALLENLGLINPLSIAWDRVPYSFVINWFVPVGVMLNSLTDLVGYDVMDPYYTTMVRKTASGSVRETNPYDGKSVWAPRTVERLDVQRKLGVPSFKLPKPALPSLNLTRALIAMALFDKTRDPAPRKR